MSSRRSVAQSALVCFLSKQIHPISVCFSVMSSNNLLFFNIYPKVLYIKLRLQKYYTKSICCRFQAALFTDNLCTNDLGVSDVSVVADCQLSTLIPNADGVYEATYIRSNSSQGNILLLSVIEVLLINDH